MTRPSFDEVAFEITRTIAQRSTCPRLHTAAIIMTPDHRLVASGYNGSLPGLEHCDRNRMCAICGQTGQIGFFTENHQLTKITCPTCNGTLYYPPKCLLVDGHCVRTVHAEANAIAQAAKYGPPLNGCEIYVLHQPCLTCTKLIVASGITAIHYDQPYTIHTEEAKIADELLLLSNIKLYTTV
jgi:dCMP deaminase